MKLALAGLLILKAIFISPRTQVREINICSLAFCVFILALQLAYRAHFWLAKQPRYYRWLLTGKSAIFISDLNQSFSSFSQLAQLSYFASRSRDWHFLPEHGGRRCDSALDQSECAVPVHVRPPLDGGLLTCCDAWHFPFVRLNAARWCS